MPELGVVTTALLVVAAAASPAFAHSHHGDSDSGTHVRDHRGSGSSSGSSTHVRDHRHDDVYVHVRDHRGEHPRSEGAVAYAGDDDEVVDDGGPAEEVSSRAAWMLELGGVARRFRGPSFTRAGTYDSTDPYMLSSGAGSDADTAAGAFAIRALVPVGDALYAGAEVEIGGLVRSPIRLMADSPDLHIASQTMIGSAAVVGARTRLGRLELDGELAGGVRLVSTSIEPIDATDQDPSSNETVPSLLLEARAGAAVWVSPHVFVGGQVGVGIVDHSDLGVGLTIGLSSRMFGGR